MALTETQGVYCAHPLGGCRMAESSALSERCAERLVAPGADFGLPRRPSHWRAAVPP